MDFINMFCVIFRLGILIYFLKTYKQFLFNIRTTNLCHYNVMFINKPP